MNDLEEGKLVIIDQSAGEPEQNQAAAERVMLRIYQAQSARFRSALANMDPTKEPETAEATKGHIIVYVEEAHNLLPKAGRQDNLTTVWAKTAKQGSKLNIGMVLATQAPSSVMPEILNETDNWVLAYLNSERERRLISQYMDFADFAEQIGKVSEQGFVRIRTLSQAYTVPVQLGPVSELKIPTPPTARAETLGTGDKHAIPRRKSWFVRDSRHRGRRRLWRIFRTGWTHLSLRLCSSLPTFRPCPNGAPRTNLVAIDGSRIYEPFPGRLPDTHGRSGVPRRSDNRPPHTRDLAQIAGKWLGGSTGAKKKPRKGAA